MLNFFIGGKNGFSCTLVIAFYTYSLKSRSFNFDTDFSTATFHCRIVEHICTETSAQIDEREMGHQVHLQLL